ncbi:hypothetical protein ACJX0J_039853, partial [Zea mays]
SAKELDAYNNLHYIIIMHRQIIITWNCLTSIDTNLFYAYSISIPYFVVKELPYIFFLYKKITFVTAYLQLSILAVILHTPLYVLLISLTAFYAKFMSLFDVHTQQLPNFLR